MYEFCWIKERVSPDPGTIFFVGQGMSFFVGQGTRFAKERVFLAQRTIFFLNQAIFVLPIIKQPHIINKNVPFYWKSVETCRAG